MASEQRPSAFVFRVGAARSTSGEKKRPQHLLLGPNYDEAVCRAHAAESFESSNPADVTCMNCRRQAGGLSADNAVRAARHEYLSSWNEERERLSWRNLLEVAAAADGELFTAGSRPGSLTESGWLHLRLVHGYPAVHAVVHVPASQSYATACGRTLDASESLEVVAESTCLRCRSYVQRRTCTLAAGHPHETLEELLLRLAQELVLEATSAEQAHRHDTGLVHLGLLRDHERSGAPEARPQVQL
jgi:hypothetical protein